MGELGALYLRVSYRIVDEPDVEANGRKRHQDMLIVERQGIGVFQAWTQRWIC